jgi:phosphoribosylformylglycinamidine (FGAM) synthase-like amidotransferase family enzyme
MKFGVIIFPGSNCDHDAFWTIQQVAKQPVTFLWHDSPDLENCDAIIVPGGFAFGDYLRTGAIAKFSPVMDSVRKFAAERRPGARHLQRLSDSVRVRTAARSAHAQRRPEIRLQAGAA